MEACSSRFTAAEGGARLAAAAASKNILAVEYASFIPVRLLYEKAYQIRGSLFEGRKRSAYVTRASRVPVVGYEMKLLTDLAVAQAQSYGDVYDWCAELETKEVLVCTAPVLKRLLEEELLSIANMNVLIIDSCHMVYEDNNLKYIMQKYKQCDVERPLILALTYPLFGSNRKDIEKLQDTTQDDKASKDTTQRDNNSENEARENEIEDTQINTRQSGIADVDCKDTETKDDSTVPDTIDNEETQINNDNTIKTDLSSTKIAKTDNDKDIDVSNDVEIETTVDKTINNTVNTKDTATNGNNSEIKATSCREISIRDTNTDEGLNCKELAIIDSVHVKEVVIDKDDAITKKETATVSQSEMEMGVYENLDDFNMYEKLEWKIEELEEELCCQMDLAEDIDGGKRLSGAVTKPRELIIEYITQASGADLSQEYRELDTFMRATVHDALEFIHDHRHDPTEIYGDELYEEFINIPDPKLDPKQMFHQFLYILDQLGPYGADKAAFSLLTKLEKLKIKVPYERHFLLLCLCTSVFVKIRCYADSVFGRYENDWDKIRAFCTPKVLRFAEILELFHPPSNLADKAAGCNTDIEYRLFGNSTGCKGDTQSQSVATKMIKDKEFGCDVDINSVSQVESVSGDDINIGCKMDINGEDMQCANIENNVITESEGVVKISANNNGTVSDIDIRCVSEEANIKNDASKVDIQIDAATKMLNDIQLCDFTALGDKIQDRVNTYEANLEDINDIDTANISSNVTNDISETDTGNIGTKMKMSDDHLNMIDTKIDIKPIDMQNGASNSTNNTEIVTKPNVVLNIDSCASPCEVPRRRGGRAARGGRGGRARGQRPPAPRAPLQLNPDALCGVVYMQEPLMAKIMFMLIVDMSRCNARLSHLSAQYCAAEQGAAPGAEPRECQRRGKKQEDVLKKFRMHECNLLLATSALEEGIDLPRCNLVLRWDVPPSYRSYVSCRGRARAARAAAALLAARGAAGSELLLHHLATYRELDQIITRKCGCGIQDEPPQAEEDHADVFTGLVKPYTPNDTRKNNDTTVNDSKINVESKENNDEAAHDVEINDTKSLLGSSERNDVVNNDVVNNDVVNNDVGDEIKRHDSLLDERDDDCTQIEGDSTGTINIKEQMNDKSNLNKENIDTAMKYDVNSIKNHIKINDKPEQNDETNDKNNDTAQLSNESIPKIIKNSENNISETLDIKDIDTDVQCNKCGICECCVSRCDISVNKKDISVDKCDVKKNINDTDPIASVDLNSAIALINRYCGKLPSDTFTRLAPQWWLEAVSLPVQGSSLTRTAYICTLRLPLNCPVKYNIVGHPMPTRVLARRMVALQACRILHKSGELDDQLMPIGKENFKAVELEAGGGGSGGACGGSSGGSGGSAAGDAARPGTTKRRQYYYKRTAWAFTDCQPVEDTSDSEIDPPGDQAKPSPRPTVKETKPGGKRNMLYAIVSRLWCALPERYNTRGRRLHAPQHARQAIGILMARHEPDSLQIPAFPVYTRSGEVRVSVEHAPGADVRLSPRRARRVRRFMRFVFAEVLRVRRRGMRLQSEGATHNNYYIVPTCKTIGEDGSSKIDIDWAFLELIYQHTEMQKHSELEKPMFWQQDEEEGGEEAEKEAEEKNKKGRVKKMENPLLKAGETFVFDAEKYREAVVTPWYRNQDQPQFFLVAEICWNLSPESAFPSATHGSFREYYTSKYGVALTQPAQPLLDVDHTSARLNLLTPRYVNRKGVALPVSSERTRRAKRDRLDQKQILVPELCRVHPFAAPLWFATVALPCVLYRINALLIADEIRRAVAIDVGLGVPKITEDSLPGFQWPPLDFGWSLAEVLNADSEKNVKKREEEESESVSKEMPLTEEQENKEAEKVPEESKEKTINDILQEKEDAESGFEIGTWSNEMASSLAEDEDEPPPLPPNITFCTSASGGANWYDPVEKPRSRFNPSRTFSVADSDCSFISSDLDSDDSDLDFDGSDEDTDTSGFCSSKNSNAAMGVRIEYKTAHEAEAVDLERNKKVNPAPLLDPADDADDRAAFERLVRAGTAPEESIEKFRDSVSRHKQEIVANGHLIAHSEKISQILPPIKDQTRPDHQTATEQTIAQIFPYTNEMLTVENGQINIQSIEKNKRVLLKQLKESLPGDVVKKMNCFSMVDIDIDSPGYVNEKVVNVGFDEREKYERAGRETDDFQPYYEQKKGEFDFDYQPKLEGHPGPSPSVILQALTMSNANDGINLERLETIGDSFLKFAITAYLYCAHPTVHEGKLSHMRSKQVSNLNLYRLGRGRRLGARMIASKFEPHDNWLPPCHKPPHTHHHAHVDTPNPEASQDATGCFIPYNLITQHSIPDKSIADSVEALIGAYLLECGPRGALLFMAWLGIRVLPCHRVPLPPGHPYVAAAASRKHHQEPPPPPSPKRQRSASTSSECSSSDEECGKRHEPVPELDWSWRGRQVGSLRPYQDENGRWMQPIFGELKAPPSPLLRYIEDPEGELEQMLSGYEALERTLRYRFRDRALLLQALTHASHHCNRLTDCYQRLEFLGDAILDYLITRHLYEDPRRHSPGALTDLRSALVNNTIFATLAARHGFHKYFRHMSPGLNEVLTKYVKIQEENGHSISEEHYLIQEDEMEQAEDVEVPKALGDLFESVAGAIFLDSGMSLDAVWKSYVTLMGAELEAFSAAAPKSPVRELLEAEPDTAKFGKPERLADGRRVRVCVEVFGRGAFKGVGRNYRIAKGTAARCALRHLRQRRAR